MRAIEIARRLAELGNKEGAVKAYGLALHESGGKDPAGEFEAAAYLLSSGGDYRVAYTTFVSLYNGGFARADCLDVLNKAFYNPNVKLRKNRYERNCKRLKGYPYLFRKDFPRFEDLPIRFYPFGEDGYIPFFPREERFGDYVNPRLQTISRNFFHDLDNPVFASDVYSQYELEYLWDNVRRSEQVAMDNHVYLHYTNWEEFCAYLQVLNFKDLLKWEKFVFLMEEEKAQYPIDFKERFGIDYSVYLTVSIGIREVTRLIWHTQLSSHNGGDFFNEIFDNHPNLISLPSLMYEDLTEATATIHKELGDAEDEWDAAKRLKGLTELAARELYLLKDRTDKDILVGIFLSNATWQDMVPRITPAVFFQPHFAHLDYDLLYDNSGLSMLSSETYDTLSASPLLLGFKYIKTFTPMRRPTTSYGATVKFMRKEAEGGQNAEGKGLVVGDEVYARLCNRSFMIDWQDRLFKDSVLVRFEDGKLNPKATFTALAAFLDLPYTESMTYCSMYGEIDPESLEGNVRGFDPAAVYRTYDEYANDAERYFLEYFLRDVYEYCGYGFQYYDGEPVDEARAEELIQGFTTINGLMRQTWQENVISRAEFSIEGKELPSEVDAKARELALEQFMAGTDKNRLEVARLLLKGLFFINKKGQPLHMMPKLKLDEALLEQPLYH